MTVLRRSKRDAMVPLANGNRSPDPSTEIPR